MALLKGIGKQIMIAIGLETTRGTAQLATAKRYWLATDDFEAEERFGNAVNSQVYGIIEDNIGQTRVKNWMEGSMRIPLSGTTSAVIFRSLFGSTTSVLHSGETVIYDNTIGVDQNVQHDSITLFVHDPIPTPGGATADYSHANTIVHKVDIDYSLGNFVTLTAGFRGIVGSAAAVAFTTPAVIVDTRFVPQYLTFKTATTYSGPVPHPRSR